MVLRLALRLAVSLVAMLVVWTTASVARADAPLCDHRGAITFAESPALQVMDIGCDVAPDDGAAADAGDAFLQEDFPRAPAPDSAWSFDAVVPTVHAVAPHTFYVMSYPRSARVGARSGIALSLDRPPR